MTVSVREGRLSEVPTAAATGMDRRAFGEFEGPRGELASYALGWATDTEPRAARLTVGIGAGNPGGATFHALVAVGDDGGCACSLIDDPFEDVPEGGPHLDAEAARAHEDLPFIWAVTDAVMARDRRAWWMRHWLLGTPAILTPEVFERHEPILLVSNDADDELWQLIGKSDAGTQAKFGHLWHAVDEDPTLIDVLDLEPGCRATRTAVGEPWTRQADAPGA